jgi:hypothetical protein
VNVRVEPNRFLSVACEPDERIVFDRKETKYHLLRDSAARLWDEICEGGTFEVAQVSSEDADPIPQLIEAGLIGIETEPVGEGGMTRRVWLRRTSKASAAAVVLPLVATIVTPRLGLGQIPSLEEVGPERIPEAETLLGSPEELLDTPKETKEKKQKEDKDNRGGNNTENTESTDNGTRTRTRTRRGQGSETTSSETTSSETTGTRTRTRRRDRNG